MNAECDLIIAAERCARQVSHDDFQGSLASGSAVTFVWGRQRLMWDIKVGLKLVYEMSCEAIDPARIAIFPRSHLALKVICSLSVLAHWICDYFGREHDPRLSQCNKSVEFTFVEYITSWPGLRATSHIIVRSHLLTLWP